MLKLEHVSLQRGGKTLFDNVFLTLHPGQKTGLVGTNGSGKSSLFALLHGAISADNGIVELPPRWVIAHVEQHAPALPAPAREFVLDGDAELRRLEHELAAAERDQDGYGIAAAHAGLEAIDGYSARARAGKLLAGLGFTDDQLEQPVADFSGGWRERLKLARALMCRSDLLLLDEPTNHLDLDAVIWLEQWLRGYSGTLLLISHDRDFLDGVVDSIAHIERRGIHFYRGNYTAFEGQYGARLAQQQAAHERQQRELQRLQRFIDRFRAKATKARQAQSRIKALERLELIAPAHAYAPFRFDFASPARLPSPLLTVDDAVVGYRDRAVLNGIKLTLLPGTRVGILGRNGAGKSTLIRLLAGDLPLLKGRRQDGQGLVIGYFAQHQLDQLHPDWSPLDHLRQIDPQAGEQALRDFLGGFGFSGAMALAPSAPFSGGEKARLVLALLVWTRPNLLLLDEPTNHLDLDMRHALTMALQGYTGALLLVSHDRHLLRTTCDDFLLVHDGRIEAFAGDLEDYRRWLAETAVTVARPNVELSAPASRHDRRRAEADQRSRLAARRRPLERRLQQLEQRLARLEQERDRIEGKLADPALYQASEKDRLKALVRSQGKLRNELTQCENDWLAVQDELDALAAASGASA